MKVYSFIVAVLAFLTTLPEAGAWDLSRRTVSCRVTAWTEWSIPEGFGTITRERAILRHPSGGGTPCPTLQETQETNKMPSPNQTAVSIVNTFLKRPFVKNLTQPRRKKRQDQTTGAVRDLLIIVDSSGSIGPRNFTIAKDQLSRLLGLLCPYPDPFNLDKPYHRAALLHYSNSVTEEFDFDDKNGLCEIQTSIRNMKFMGDETCTARAFERAQDMFSPERGMRNGRQVDVVREVLILTDGVSTRCGNATQAALNLRQDLSINATVFGLAIGDFHQRGRQEILSYVSKPAPKHVFAFQDFRTLTRVVNQVDELVNENTVRCHPFDFEQ